MWTFIESSDFKTTVWSGGTTTELFLYPKGGSYKDRRFDLRLSSATVDSDSSLFTALPGFTRLIAPLDGTLELSHPEQNKHLVLSPYMLHRFDGGIVTESRGRARDFNVMFSRFLEAEACVMKAGEIFDLKRDFESLCFLFSFEGSTITDETLNEQIRLFPFSLCERQLDAGEACRLRQLKGSPVFVIQVRRRTEG